MSSVRYLLQIKGNDTWKVSPEDTVFDALTIMSNKDIGALLVMEDEKLVGILSERDYARKVIIEGRKSKETLARDIMTGDVITVHPNQTVEECMHLMDVYHIRHLPVVEDGRVVGVLSVKDVLKDIIFIQREKIRGLEKKISGS